MQWLAGLEAANLSRVVPLIVLGWLAFFFGRTLRAGATPLIERIARVRDPQLSPSLCRYCRRLTLIWTLYFIGAALLSASINLPALAISALVWVGAVTLFVGEHWCRPLLFPGTLFPNLLQQIADTTTVWRRGS